MKNKENYLIRILLILIIIPSMWWYFSTKKRYREMNTKPHIEMEIKKFLKKRYNEDFEVKATPYIYDDYCRALIVPKRYIGTSKEHDLFYKAEAYVGMEKVAIINEYRQDVIASSYNEILIKEDLEKMCKPKLEELFGKNVLVALQLEGMCYYKNCKEELEHRKKEKNQKPLSGGIYIFGRVESEKDREKYRRGIYEFIQYLKQEGMFEYVDVVIRIYDERCLTLSYKEVTSKLKEERKIQKNSTDYKKVREKILSTLTKEYSQMIEKEKQEKLNNIIKSDMVDEKGWTNDYSYAQIYQYVIWSPKFLKNTPNTLLKSYKPIEYKNIKEIKLLDSFKIDYHEYDEKALYNNEWGD